MKVLIVNKFYYNRGGDCVCTLSLEQLLRENGHETAVFAMRYNENFDTPWSRYFAPEVSFAGGIGEKLKAAQRIFGGSGVKTAFARLLADFKPDIVHFNNIHSYLSPAIVEMAKKAGARTVWTLHDYKLICPSYSCLADGKICEECIGKSKKGVIDKRCMKGSRAASLLAYWEARHWNRKRLEACTDAFICPSRFIAQKMEQDGFDKAKLHTVCNFIDPAKLSDNPIKTTRKDYYLYVGRLSKEKGVETLLKSAVQFPYPLKIAGGGPLADDLKERFGRCPNIEFLGFQNAAQIRELFENARFSVMPSECYDNNPLSVIESLCFGTPVVGARIGGIPELISPSDGFLYRSGSINSLSNNIAVAWDSPFDYAAIADNARTRFSTERYLTEILQIYKQ